ncbi:hypothetical protein L1987_43528 [Smallanthus sonchifolius]|uniref:Uncharacterized protein n=1 Tax=Smallanthus sonchifolius TaxID=185202 RepID=A0ACB9GLV7_9ASTR|nr:hypothetical protein L1987_43528 [Smallanthus sonchifolius]
MAKNGTSCPMERQRKKWSSFGVFNKTSKIRTAIENGLGTEAKRLGTAAKGLGTEAKRVFLFKEMRLKGVLPNEATIECVLPAYTITTDLQQGLHVAYTTGLITIFTALHLDQDFAAVLPDLRAAIRVQIMHNLYVFINVHYPHFGKFTGHVVADVL